MAQSKLLALRNKTGYPLTQNNGDRLFGPPPDWTGPAPLKGCEVFVGNIPREIIEDELVPLFSRVGKIYEMRLMTVDFLGSSRGFGFVTYTNRADAMAACSQINGYEIRPGRPIRVVKSVDNCRLYVRGIPMTKTKEEILEEFSKKVDGLVDVILYKNRFDRSLNRGFVFVEFVSHSAAAIARRSLLRRSKKPWGDPDVSVDWAEPEPDPDDDEMSQVRVLFVRNFLFETTSEKIQAVFEKAIDHEVERVKKMYDYAFVNFFERSHAELALMRLQNTEIDGALIELRWAKPVDREVYKIQKLLKENSQSNMDLDLTDLLQMYKEHVEKQEYMLDFKEDEVIGSGSAAESPCGSTTETIVPDFAEGIYSAPTELDAMCKGYGWAMPQYTSTNSLEFWVCQLDLTHVGLPLLTPPRSVGPFLSRTCNSKEMARADAAEAALNYLKALPTENIQPTAQQCCQTAPPPMYEPTILPPMPYYGMPYRYLSPPLYACPAAFRTNIMQQPALQCCQTAPPPMYQPTILPPMPYYGLPYRYVSPPLYACPAVIMPIWRPA